MYSQFKQHKTYQPELWICPYDWDSELWQDATAAFIVLTMPWGENPTSIVFEMPSYLQVTL